MNLTWVTLKPSPLQHRPQLLTGTIYKDALPQLLFHSISIPLFPHGCSPSWVQGCKTLHVPDRSTHITAKYSSLTTSPFFPPCTFSLFSSFCLAPSILPFLFIPLAPPKKDSARASSKFVGIIWISKPARLCGVHQQRQKKQNPDPN